MSGIGILGGSFDPIHVGHISVAKQVLLAYQLDHIRFIPCKDSVLNKTNVANADHRRTMVKLAIEPNNQFLLDDRELTRDTKSYTVETLESLTKEFPEDKLYFIVGSDAYRNFEQWHKWQRILELATLIVAYRPGYAFKKAIAHNIEFLETDTVNTSSTEIRTAIENGQSVDKLVPGSVMAYIKRNCLYE